METPIKKTVKNGKVSNSISNENVSPSDIGCLTESESDKISFGEETSEAERHKIKSTSQNMLIRRMHQEKPAAPSI